MPDGCSSFVRNWFISGEGETDPNMLSVEDNLGAVLQSEELHNIVRNAAGDFAAKAVSSPLLKPVYPVKVKTLVGIAEKFGADDRILSMVGGFLQTIKK